MATTNHFLFDGISGKVGDLVFKEVNGKTIVCRAPVRKKNEVLTEKQKEQRKRFSQAVTQTKEALADPVLKAYFTTEAKSKKLISAHAAAMAHYLKTLPTAITTTPKPTND
jgi:hypothetical protein